MRRLLAMLSAPVLLTSALVSVGLATPAHAACTSIPSTADPDVTLTVYRVGRSLNVNDKVMLSGFEAGWVESRMNNLPCGDKSSLGGPSPATGTTRPTPPARSPSACSAPASPTGTTTMSPSRWACRASASPNASKMPNVVPATAAWRSPRS